MSLLGERSASFIVRIWREQGEYETSAPEWRGMAEHIGSNKRPHYFRDFGGLLDFLRPHLEAIGIRPEQRFWESVDSALDPATPTVSDVTDSAADPRPARKQPPR